MSSPRRLNLGVARLASAAADACHRFEVLTNTASRSVKVRAAAHRLAMRGAIMEKISERIAAELGVGPGQVAAAMEMLAEGATVPFIARYRKEKTGGLDDTQLRKVEERLGYLTDLKDRCATVLKSIAQQGKLTPELARRIESAASKVELEDLYAP